MDGMGWDGCMPIEGAAASAVGASSPVGAGGASSDVRSGQDKRAAQGETMGGRNVSFCMVCPHAEGDLL